ncbi:hypothetical protein TNCV_1425991 [Trichonephila clavipes]|nr:hypothetical protein TNCV_1425991 [Trichonephila clavipes]
MSSSPVPLKTHRVGQRCTLNLSRAETSSRWQINLEVDSDDVQELLDCYNQELTVDEITEMHEQDIEELESSDPVQSEDQMTVGNVTEDLSLRGLRGVKFVWRVENIKKKLK